MTDSGRVGTVVPAHNEMKTGTLEESSDSHRWRSTNFTGLSESVWGHSPVAAAVDVAPQSVDESDMEGTPPAPAPAS